MNRGDVWLAEVGGKARPVVVVTRDEVISVRANVTVVELTTQARGLTVEVPVDHVSAGVDEPCVANADGLHTIPQRRLTRFVGALDDDELDALCIAVGEALGCRGPV